jgi:hypothetical protein
MADVLENQPDDATCRELTAFIRALDVDEQINPTALAWLGRGIYELSGWQQALSTAHDEHNGRTAEYLLGCRCSTIISKKDSPCSTRAATSLTRSCDAM